VTVTSCIPIVPSADLERSLRLWRDGLGFDETWWEQHDEGRLVGCGLRNGRITVMLNIRSDRPRPAGDYDAVRFYWAPEDLRGLREHLHGLGFAVSDIVERDYGQSEFFLKDDDGVEHCFGVATETPGANG